MGTLGPQTYSALTRLMGLADAVAAPKTDAFSQSRRRAASVVKLDGIFDERQVVHAPLFLEVIFRVLHAMSLVDVQVCVHDCRLR
jgi:hypothetical protein